jgi:hypothetical protein
MYCRGETDGQTYYLEQLILYVSREECDWRESGGLLTWHVRGSWPYV